MTIGDGNTILESDWLTDMNSRRTDINTLRQRSYLRSIPLAVQGITTATPGILLFTPQDNLLVMGMRVRAVGGPATSQTVTATLSVDGGDNRFLLGDTPSLVMTEPSTSAAVNMDSTAAKRYVLIKGVTYRLTLAASATFTMASCALQVRSGIRR